MTKTLTQLTKGFDYVDSDIVEKNFPLIERKHKGYKLFQFNCYISSEGAIKEIQKEGYEPANLLELLTWKKWNEKDWVIALGSVWEIVGNRYVPYLVKGGSRRYLSLYWRDDDWDSNGRFLAVRTGSKALDSKSSDLGNSDTLALTTRVEKLEKDMDKIKKIINI